MLLLDFSDTNEVRYLFLINVFYKEMIIITCALLACLLLLINIILLTSFGNTYEGNN